MKNKASLVLMEQAVMLLVFALAAALCLQCFGAAGAISGETALRDEAVLLAQNTAEQLKAGLIPAAVPGELGLIPEIREFPGELPGFRRAHIRILRGSETVFELETGWQEAVE